MANYESHSEYLNPLILQMLLLDRTDGLHRGSGKAQEIAGTYHLSELQQTGTLPKALERH